MELYDILLIFCLKYEGNMNKEQAFNECKRLKSYFPYRIVGMYQDKDSKEWHSFTGKTKARALNLVRKGHEVYTI